MTRKHRCAFCRTPIDLGATIVGARHGVLGHRGFVPLEPPIILCSETCTATYFADAPHLPPRTP